MALFEFLRRLFQLVTRHFIQMSTYDDLTDFGPVTPAIQDQLATIYYTISAALIFLGLGYELELYWKIAIYVPVVRCLGMFALYFFTPRWREVGRLCFLIAAAFLLGSSMHRMISYYIPFCEREFLPVLSGIAIVFGSFGTIANFMEIRRRMYTMSVLLSAIVLLFWFRSIMGATKLNEAYVIMGFSFFMGYVVAYSQEMVVQIRSGDADYTHHAIDLFTQMPAFIFHMITCRFKRQIRPDLSNGEV